MADVLLENTNVFEHKKGYGVEELRQKFETEKQLLQKEYARNAADYARIKKNQDNLVNDENQSAFDADEKALTAYKNELIGKQRQFTEQMNNNDTQIELLNKYEGSYAALYQIKQQNEFDADNIKCNFKEIEQTKPAGIITQEQYYEMNANPKGEVKQLALEIELPAGEKFNLTMPPYDKPGADNKNVKAQISFDDKALQELNAQKMAHIMEFCESHGLSTFQTDIPYAFDGNIDAAEKIKSLLEEVKSQKIADEQKANGKEFAETEAQKEKMLKSVPQNISENALKDVSFGLPEDNKIFTAETAVDEVDGNSQEEYAQTAAPMQQSQQAEPQPAPKAPKAKKGPKSQADAEACLEKFLEGGLRKVRDANYFKSHTGWFGSGWAKYVVYDKVDPDNRKKDGVKDKNGEVKYTYNFKLYVKKENGKFRFAYRTPGNKKIDDQIVNGLAGQFKDLGITHVRFPDGLQDAEKKLWRVALAENGIVPVGMGLDKAKAEGMLKAAKEKLTAEAFRKYRYKLAIQMEKDNIKKGKIVSPSEQDYIDSIKNSQKYLAFTESYDSKLKGMLRDRLDAADINHNDGAIEKTAAYMAMRRLFDTYKEVVDHADILNSKNLSPEEKSMIKQAGLTGPVSEFTTEQMGQLYDIMLIKSKADAKKEIDEALLAARDVNNQTSKGAKRADNVIIKEVFDGARNRFEKVNEMLAPLGVDEISFPKSFGRLHYDNFYREHPEFMKKKEPQQTQTPQQPTNSTPIKSANANSATTAVNATNAQNTKASNAFVKAFAAKKNYSH